MLIFISVIFFTRVALLSIVNIISFMIKNVNLTMMEELHSLINKKTYVNDYVTQKLWVEYVRMFDRNVVQEELPENLVSKLSSNDYDEKHQAELKLLLAGKSVFKYYIVTH